MCIYRSCYYSACQHQETVLFHYCDNAVPLNESVDVSPSASPSLPRAPHPSPESPFLPPQPHPSPESPFLPPQPHPSPASSTASAEPLHLGPNREGTYIRESEHEQQAGQQAEEAQPEKQEREEKEGEPQEKEQPQQQQSQQQQSRPQPQPQHEQQQERIVAGRAPYSGAFAIESFPSLPSTPAPQPQPASSRPAAPPAITTPASSKPVSYAAALSLPRKQPVRQHRESQPPASTSSPAPAPEQDMAAFAGFGRPNLRSLFGSSTAKPTLALNPVHHDGRESINSLDESRSLRSRQSGIRENTEDSSILPDSGEIIRHIADSSRGDINAQHIGTDSAADTLTSTTPFGGSMHDNSQKGSGSWQAIDSDLDMMKEHVSRLKAAQTAAAPKAKEETTTSPTIRKSPTRIPQPVVPPAALLQKRHEEDERQARELASRPSVVKPPSPPKQHDFPQLSKDTPKQHMREMPASSSGRKMSWAQIVSPPSSGPTGRRAAAMSLKSPDSATRTIPENDLGDSTVLISPITPSKQAPRFAQPTKASSLRKGETQRKDPSPTTVKRSPSSSPNKQVQTVQRQQKRSAIPGAWLSSPASASSDTNVAKDPPTLITPSQIEKGRTVAEEGKALVKADVAASNDQKLRKKTSSFMSPTKATTQRELATLGHENVKQVSPRAQKLPPRINTALSPVAISIPFHTVQEPLSPRTMSSNSEYIITEHPETRSPSSAVSAFLDRTSSLLAAAAQGDRSASVSPPTSQPGSRRSTIGGTTVAEILSMVARETGIPPNTYLKRRDSQGHLLLPIKAKLNKLGLLDKGKGVASQEVSSALASPLTTAMESVREKLPETPQKPSAPEAGGFESVSPQFRRKRAISSGDFSQPMMPTGVPAAGQVSATKVANMLTPSGPKSQAHSLRATAQEFKPMSQSSSLEQDAAELQRDGIVGYHSPDQWAQYTPDVRAAIMRCRDAFGRPSSSAATLPVTSPSRFWQASAGQTIPWTVGSNLQYSFSPFAPRPTMQATSQAGSRMSDTPRTGQVIKPEIDPITKRLQWSSYENDGSKIPINFGRAAIPSSGLPGTPDLSPTSEDTSPRHSPPSPPRGWSIASAASTRSRYGWAGGDGREIKFRGYGPDAERDPYNPVNFSLQNRSEGYGGGPRMIGADAGDENAAAPLAPRSRRQWAEMLGHLKIPCGSMTLEESCEILPHAGVGAYCHTCVP